METKSTGLSDIEQTPVQIWVIEDNLHYGKTINKLLNISAGMHCSHVFTSCEEAIAVADGGEQPEVILLDIGLPGISGIEGIARLKTLNPDSHIIILTMYDDSDKVFQALCAGAHGYLLKDATPEVIIGAVREVMAGGAPMNMQIARKVLDMFARFNPVKTDYGLSDREKEILSLVTQGLTKQQIAGKLFLSFHTVNSHLKNIYHKLHVNSRSSAISKVYRENIL